jgi:lipid-binding SYLF domain-containing protein
MTGMRTPFAASLLLLTLVGSTVSPAQAGSNEVKTVELAAEVVHALGDIPLKGIPRGLLHDAAGVAVIPHVVKAGLVVDAQRGRGVMLLHGTDGSWSNPIFVTLSGAGIGGQAGIEATDLVLVFKTQPSLDRAMRGKLTLGQDAAIAAGPIGRDAMAATDGRLLKAEIYSYSRSHGLFAGISIEGSHLRIDNHANKIFYGLREGRPGEVLAYRGTHFAAVENLRSQLALLSGPPLPPAVLVPVPTPASPAPTVLVPVPNPAPSRPPLPR